jgi:hypothetical protein
MAALPGAFAKSLSALMRATSAKTPLVWTLQNISG